jgi:hypothetical protein
VKQDCGPPSCHEAAHIGFEWLHFGHKSQALFDSGLSSYYCDVLAFVQPNSVGKISIPPLQLSLIGIGGTEGGLLLPKILV